MKCNRDVPASVYYSRRGCCLMCVPGRPAPVSGQNRRRPDTEATRDYLRSLPLPELRAYVHGALGARMHDAAWLTAELDLICLRLEWVAARLMLAGVDPARATYSGLLQPT